jgi:hypothetical protein
MLTLPGTDQLKVIIIKQFTHLKSIKMKTKQVKQLILSLILLTGIAGVATAQNLRLNLYSAYAFDDKVDSYYDATHYYDGKIQGGYVWGGGFEFMVGPSKGIELKYLRQNCVAPLQYYNNGIKNKDFQLGLNYILVGGSNYFHTADGKVEPYAGLGLGMNIISVRNPEPDGASGFEKFAWTVKLGTNIWVTDKVGLKLQADIISTVQAVSGGLYVGTGGTGGAISLYTTMYQWSVGGGLIFKLGK